MIESLFYPIEDALLKHFDIVCFDNFSNSNVVTIKCCMAERKDSWYNFPFDADIFYASNPYDVVNSIWEYIAKYVL